MKTATIDSICPKSKQEWREWLEQNHQTKDYIWLIVYKKQSKTPTISWSDAVDEALCFGWIDSTKKAIDSEKYMQYYGKRKAKSTWSKINKNKVAQLIDQGLMSQAGFNSIEIAKSNGNWTILDEVEDLTIPNDLEKEFELHPNSKAYFLSLNKSFKKSILQWVILAKRPQTRAKRIKEIVESASNNKKPKHFG